MNRVMAVYDSDPFYAERFAEYANQKKRIPFPVIAFSSPQTLLAYLEKQPAEILLIDGACESVSEYQKHVRQTIVLADAGACPSGHGLPAIEKYQSSDNILRAVLALYQADHDLMLAGVGGGSMTGIYSPVNRCGKTAFSIAYAKTLAREHATLYLNLEDCSGFSRLLPHTGRGDFSDALYYFKQGLLSREKLGSVVHSLGELDYIPPIRYPEDFAETGGEELAALLRHLTLVGSYQSLVVDLGQPGRTAATLLEICDIIFMPVLEDEISSAKVEEFLHYLEVSGRERVRERLQTFVLPSAAAESRGEAWLDQLLWGEIGDFTRHLVKGRDEHWKH